MVEQSSSLVMIVTGAAAADRLARLLRGLPADFPTPIVIAFDRLPDAEVLASLGAETSFEIVAMDDAPVQLAPGRVVGIPLSRRLAFTPTSIRPAAGNVDGSALFSSAAAAFGAGLTVVVLDEALVAASPQALGFVRDAGGAVVHEDGGKAHVAVDPDDVTVASEGLARALVVLLAYGAGAEAAEERNFRLLIDEVRRSSGVDFGAYKTPTVVRRLARMMAAGGFATIGQYLAHLRHHPEGYAALVRTFLINVTEFFRDPPLFDYLRDELLPPLVEHARANGNELRIWSAGCATGEEAYSLAILVAEALGDRLGEMQVRIFATDLDEQAIEFARHGVYPESALAEMPQAMREKYFTESDQGYEVKKLIRNLTVFGQHDLAQRAPFPRIDLCLCRNVLIYFAKELQQRALQLFAFSLRDGGFLVLGKAETTSPLPEYFKPVHRVFRVYERYGPRVLIPPSQIREPTPAARERIAGAFTGDRPEGRVPAGVASAIPGGARIPRGAERLGPSEYLAALLLDSPIGFVIVDRRYDVIAINHTARELLHINGVGVGEDLVHAAGGIPGPELRREIDAAFSEARVTKPHEFQTSDSLDGVPRTVMLSCHPGHDADESVANVAILLVDVTEQAQRRRDAETENIELRSRVAGLEDRAQQLSSRQRALVAANEDLTNTNVELRTTNEHLMIAAEESASAAEEIETLNEEMQATNEELETLNEELQATVEELNTTNDELEARSVEFQELASLREDERRRAVVDRERFRTALELVPAAVAIFQDGGETVYGNAAYRALVEKGRFVHEGGAKDPLDRVRRGEAFTDAYTLVAGDGTRAVRVRSEPYAGEDGIRGSVLIVEIPAAPGG